MDFRSTKNPHSGHEWRGAMRKSKPADLIAVRNIGDLDTNTVDLPKSYENQEELMK